MMTLEEIRKMKDPTDRALFEAAYWEAQKPVSWIEAYEFRLIIAAVLLFFALVIYLAIKEYKRNNPRKLRRAVAK